MTVGRALAPWLIIAPSPSRRSVRRAIRSVALDHQALADRYGCDVPLGDIRLRVSAVRARADRLMKESCRDGECVGV